jgi:hypothetical protein
MTKDQEGTIMSMAYRMMQNHECRPGGTPTGTFGPDRPSWAEPGQLTKIEGEDRWGRVVYLMRCCGERIVELVDQEERSVGAERFRTADLENPYGAYPHALPPAGYWVTNHYTRRPERFGAREPGLRRGKA